MQEQTRILFNDFLDRQAELNSISDPETKFNVDPSVQQKLIDKRQESSEFLSRINIIPVTEMKGELLGLGIGGPLISTTDTSGAGTRKTVSPTNMDKIGYECRQNNSDTHIRYALPDMDEVHKRFYPAVAPATLNPLDSFGVSERSYAGYARANFQFDLFGSDAVGDVGVRLVRTEQSSSGFVDDDDVISPVTIKRNYTNALPSLNLRFDPMDKLRVRLGLARVMTRPALSDISPRREIFSGQQRVEEGNVYLNPFVADQADLSVEFYLGREALLSAAFFYKNIKSFTATSETVEPFRGEDYLFSRIVNGEGGRVYGFELTYQQPFTFLPAPFDGLGTALTYTHSKSQTEFSPSMSAEKLPLEGLSRNSFNATLYYEKGPFGIRTSYNYRQGYVLTALGAGGTPVFVDDFGQLDISANLQLTPWLSIRAEALNILDERSYSYSGKINQITDYDRTGPKYFIGFSASF